MSGKTVDRVELRRLLREAAAGADSEDSEQLPVVAGPETPLPQGYLRRQADRVERERVIELGVTGFIVRFPDNGVLLSAISRVVGWRPNPAGSHHVPWTVKAVTGLLAFAEMYDFELTDGADAMVRQLIRDSYRGRRRAASLAAPAPADPAPEAHAAALAPAPTLAARILGWRGVPADLFASQVAWARHHWRPLVVVALALYIAAPRFEIVREAERSFLDHAPLGAAASVTTVLGALQRCENASLALGAPTPPGCDASVATRAAYERVSLGFTNPLVRIASWDTVSGLRGFAFCDQSKALEECWAR